VLQENTDTITYTSIRWDCGEFFILLTDLSNFVLRELLHPFPTVGKEQLQCVPLGLRFEFPQYTRPGDVHFHLETLKLKLLLCLLPLKLKLLLCLLPLKLKLHLCLLPLKLKLLLCLLPLKLKLLLCLLPLKLKLPLKLTVPGPNPLPALGGGALFYWSDIQA
jgi:hypothetical protein